MAAGRLRTAQIALAFVAFALVGAGCAAIVPALFRVAGSVPGVASGAGIAAVATAGYSGAVINGPAIGFLARGIGLTGGVVADRRRRGAHRSSWSPTRTVGSRA
jgi:hypothetical protein